MNKIGLNRIKKPNIVDVKTGMNKNIKWFRSK